MNPTAAPEDCAAIGALEPARSWTLTGKGAAVLDLHMLAEVNEALGASGPGVWTTQLTLFDGDEEDGGDYGGLLDMPGLLGHVEQQWWKLTEITVMCAGPVVRLTFPRQPGSDGADLSEILLRRLDPLRERVFTAQLGEFVGGPVFVATGLWVEHDEDLLTVVAAMLEGRGKTLTGPVVAGADVADLHWSEAVHSVRAAGWDDLPVPVRQLVAVLAQELRAPASLAELFTAAVGTLTDPPR